MIIEQKCFLELLSDSIAGVSSAERDLSDVDFEKLFKISSQQCLSAIIYAQIKNNPFFKETDENVQKKYKLSFTSSILRSVALDKSLEELGEKFTSAGIEYIPFKGAVIKDYYPDPELRTMGDIDLVIRESDRDKVHNLMCESGYIAKYTVEPVWVYSKNSITYEIHTKMVTSTDVRFEKCLAFFEKVWDHTDNEPGNTRHIIELNFHYVYILYHMAKHMYGRGSGFRPFVDLSLIISKERDRLDYEMLTESLKSLNLLEFAETALSFCDRWFGVNCQFANGFIDDEFANSAVDKIFADGVFGKNNADNEIGFVTRKTHTSKSPFFISAMRVVLQEIFISYDIMRHRKKYSFVDHKPWLLPIAWTYRFFSCVIEGKLKQAIKRCKLAFRKKEIETRNRIITNWGL